MTIKSSGSLTSTEIAAEYGGSKPYKLSAYYRGAGLVPSGGSSKIPTSGTNKFSNYYGTTRIIPFPLTGGAWYGNYDFYFGTDYSSCNPLRIYFARSVAGGVVSFRATSYTTYCGAQPTWEWSSSPGSLSDGGTLVEYVDYSVNWNKGCCNGNNNNIYVTFRIRMTASSNITAQLLSNRQDGQWGC